MSAEQNPLEPSPAGEAEPDVPAPAPAPSPAVEAITWDNAVKNYFTAEDVQCMIDNGGFDLSKKEDVKANAQAIYRRTKNGSMPMTDDPARKWSGERVANFKAWIDAGFP
ncbi:hypothetical protein OQA88_4852 [Cercophora sp. LCS_1]